MKENKERRLKKIVAPKGLTNRNQDRCTHFDVNNTFAEENLSHERVGSDIHRNNNNDVHTIHTYNTYNQLKDVQSKERRRHFTTSYSPTIYKRFREAVHRTQPYDVKPNRVIEDFMIDYVVKSAEDRKQPKLTQFFINKPEQVNIAKEQVVVQKPEQKPIDYSKLSLEELEGRYEVARKLNRMGQMQTIAFELKKRKFRK